MKILVVSHTYIVDLNCEKLRSLVHLDPSVEVTVVIPKYWIPGGVQNKTIESQAKHEGRFRVLPIYNFHDHNQGLLSFGMGLATLVKDFKPDIIQVEQGAKSLAYAELISLNSMLGLKAKNVFFTWWNLPYDNKFPVSLLERFNLKNTHGLIAGNQDGVDILKDHGYTGPSCVIPQLGVDERLFKPAPQPKLAARHGIKEGEFVVGFVGRFVPEKGLMVLFEAMSHLKTTLEEEKPFKLLMVGRGPFKPILQKMAIGLEVEENVMWIDSVSHKQVPEYINLMDTLVLPSMTSYDFETMTAVGWKEQFGHVLIEAMACQVPVIGSDCGEIPNVIKADGLVFPETESIDLAEQIQILMNDPQKRQTLAERGRIRAMSEYTNKALAKKQLEFYETLL
ncbi:MAG: hormogonium polysaccharide biosynthesis glycosyltransferase HpsO [Phormidesmis sp.]